MRTPLVCYDAKAHSHKELTTRVRMHCRIEDNGYSAHCFLCNIRVKCSRSQMSVPVVGQWVFLFKND